MIERQLLVYYIIENNYHLLTCSYALILQLSPQIQFAPLWAEGELGLVLLEFIASTDFETTSGIISNTTSYPSIGSSKVRGWDTFSTFNETPLSSWLSSPESS